MNTAMTFTAATETYALAKEATPMSVLDQLTARLDQLCSMLYMTTGESFDSFNLQNEHIKHSYLWACSMAAEECNQLIGLLPRPRGDWPEQSMEQQVEV